MFQMSVHWAMSISCIYNKIYAKVSDVGGPLGYIYMHTFKLFTSI
jgi:hypothetical protein